MQIIIGIIIGITLCTVGVRGCADLVDTGVQKTQGIIKESVK